MSDGKNSSNEVKECTLPGQLYGENETILAQHGPLWFEAKVLKAEQRNGKVQYYLHYQGWNKKWDDWRPVESDSELMKFDEAGRRVQAEAKLKMQADRMKSKEKETKKGSATDNNSKSQQKDKENKNKKRKTEGDETIDADETDIGGQNGEIKLKLTGLLKKQLIQDWENITRQQKLVTLPRTVNVAALLKEFENSKQRQDSSAQMVKEVCAGVQQYFDRALPTCLLYKHERPQFKDISAAHPNLSMSEIYGAEHLLRLFVKLPTLLSCTKLEAKESIVLSSKLNEMLKWMDKKAHGGTFFLQEYEPTTKEYLTAVEAMQE